MVDVDPDSTPGLKNEKRAKKGLADMHAHLFNLQERLWS